MAKKQATEAQLAALHQKVVKIYGITLDQMIQKLEDEDEDFAFVVDPKILTLINKFLSDNSIYCIPDDQNDASPLAQKLAEIRKQSIVIPIKQEA